MKCLSPAFLVIVLTSICCASCKEDPELVAKRDKQRLEISRLREELEVMDEKLKTLPPDVSADLEKAELRAKEQAAEVARLEAEITDLQFRKRTIQAEFDSYRAKYQAK